MFGYGLIASPIKAVKPLKKDTRYNQKQTLKDLMISLTKSETGGILWKIPLRTTGKPG